jgi:type II secretory pathway pseudopilin PulG
MMDKYEILSVIAPIAAPAAPATMLINILYADLMRETVNANFALFAAVASGIGAEASGMIAAYVGIQAYRKQKYGLMWVAILAFVAYAVFMAVGISAAQNPLTMVSMIVISIIAYLAVATLTDLRAILQDAAAEARIKIDQMEAERKLQNARNRGAKLGSASDVSYTKESETFAGNDWRRVSPDDRARITGMSTAQIQDAFRVSERTAQNWKHYAQEATSGSTQ